MAKTMFEAENSNEQVLPYLLMQMYFVLLFLPICMCTATLVSTLRPSASFCWCHPKLNLFEDLLVVGAIEGLFPTQQNVPAETGRKFQVVHQIDCLKFT